MLCVMRVVTGQAAEHSTPRVFHVVKEGQVCHAVCPLRIDSRRMIEWHSRGILCTLALLMACRA